MPLTLPSPTNNSVFALEKLRYLIDHYNEVGETQLPPERELAEELGFSRRAIRRALEVLETEGRIWRRQGAGTFIGGMPRSNGKMIQALVDQTDILEVMEARLRLEPQLAQLAALRATVSDIQRMRGLAAKISSATDADSRELWDGALHRHIAVAAGNTLLLALFDVIDKVRQNDAWCKIRERARSVENQSLYCSQHEMIVAAIGDRDPVQAENAMRRHILSLQESLLSLTASNPSHVPEHDKQ